MERLPEHPWLLNTCVQADQRDELARFWLAAPEDLLPSLWSSPVGEATKSMVLALTPQTSFTPEQVATRNAIGIVAVEAMASGLALVSSAVGGAAVVFEDGKSGLSFEAGNSTSLAAQLERLWRDPALLEKLQNNGEKRARERFSVQRSAEDLETLLIQLKRR